MVISVLRVMMDIMVIGNYWVIRVIRVIRVISVIRDVLLPLHQLEQWQGCL